MTDQPPIIPNYQLLHPIGAGSSSNVWLAKDRYGERRAIKVMRAEFVGDYHYQRRFEREVKAQQTLYDVTSHVPRIFHYDATHHPPYIVMDFVDGLDLNRMIAKGDITAYSLISRLKWIEALAVTLAKAHSIKVSPSDSHGLIHRDIKPSNIRLQGERLYLLDFSISLPSNVEIENTQTAMTIRYSAPEGIASEASDVFSLGLVAYEILYEIHPFTTMKEADAIPINLYHDYLVKKLVDETWRLPSMNITRMPDLEKAEVKAQVDIVFKNVFALNYNERYQTPIEFYHDLWSAIYSESVTQKPTVTPHPGITKIFPELSADKLSSTLQFVKDANVQLVLPIIALFLVIGVFLIVASRSNQEGNSSAIVLTESSGESTPVATDLPQLVSENTVESPSQTSTPNPSSTSIPSPTSTSTPTTTPTTIPTSMNTSVPSHTPTVLLIAPATATPTATSIQTATVVVVTLSLNEQFSSQIVSQATPVLNEPVAWGLRNIRADTSSLRRISLNLVYVPAGCYLVGENDQRCIENGFWIDNEPVTNSFYDLCLTEGKCTRPAFGDDYDPAGALSTQSVVGVNWFMAENYCLWRNGRLPTEYEWDYAMTHLSTSINARMEEWVSTIYSEQYGTDTSASDHNKALEIFQQSTNVAIVVKRVSRNQLMRRNEQSVNLAENLTFRCVQEIAN